jgi:hypothetical protein
MDLSLRKIGPVKFDAGGLVPLGLARLIDLAPAPILDQFDDWERALPALGELVLMCRRLPPAGQLLPAGSR